MKWLVPAVLQVTETDCAPAALSSALRGFGVTASYEAVRQLCGTNAEGTTLSEIEQAALQFGITAEERLITLSELLLIVREGPVLVTVHGPFGAPHVVLIWRSIGNWLQVMDPAEGRRWLSREQLRGWLVPVSAEVEASQFEEFVRQESFAKLLLSELKRFTTESRARALYAFAAAGAGYQGLARLDALGRYVAELRERFGVSVPEVKHLLQIGMQEKTALVIPERHYYGRPGDVVSQNEASVVVTGCAVVVLTAPARLPEAVNSSCGNSDLVHSNSEQANSDTSVRVSQPPSETGLRPLGTLSRAIWVLRSIRGATDRSSWLLLVSIGILVGLLHVIEGLLLGALVDVLGQLGQPLQRALAVLFAASLVGIIASLEAPLTYRALRLGSRLDLALRRELSEKILCLEAQYFDERPPGDTVERAYVLHGLRGVPVLVLSAVRLLVGWLATSVAMVWVNPDCFWILTGSALVSIGVPIAASGMLLSRDLQFRNAAADLAHRYFDCLKGLGAIFAQGAAPAERERAEPLLERWRAAGDRLTHAALVMEFAVVATTTAITATLFLQYVTGGQPQRAGGFLYLFWAASFPGFGREFSLLIKQVPSLVTVLSRLAEPLLNAQPKFNRPPQDAPESVRGVRIELDEVKVSNRRADILRRVHLNVSAGDHIAIVGSSGAGKSSLLSLLLGLLSPSSGELRVDGRPLSGQALEQLRLRTTWLDPSVHLWNSSLLSNLVYGANASEVPLAECIQEAELSALIENLSSGLQGPLGEAGCAISGGEGQRVRLGRAICQARDGLILFDEPFRGLDRDVRCELLKRARRRFADSTFLCVTHDIADALTFPRVVVMNNGEIAEDGAPQALLTRPDSLLRAMLEDEQRLNQTLATGGLFRGLRLRRGRLVEWVKPALKDVSGRMHAGAAE